MQLKMSFSMHFTRMNVKDEYYAMLINIHVLRLNEFM